MSIVMWIFTLALHGFILTVLYKRNWSLLWFPLTLLCVLGEAAVIADALTRYGQDSWPYFRTVVLFDALNVILYGLCIIEARRKQVNFLAITMGLFLIVKVFVLATATYSLDWWSAGKHMLLYANTGCVLLWAGWFALIAPGKEQRL